jgi:hypothetical protein
VDVVISIHCIATSFSKIILCVLENGWIFALCFHLCLMHPFSPDLFICKQFLYCKTIPIMCFRIAYMSLWIGWNYCAHLHGFEHGITKTIKDLLVNKWCSLFCHLNLGFRIMGLGTIICCLFASELRIYIHLDGGLWWCWCVWWWSVAKLFTSRAHP